MQTEGNSYEGSNAAQTAAEQAAAAAVEQAAAAIAKGKQPMDMATEFDASSPGSMAHEAVKQRFFFFFFFFWVTGEMSIL